MGKAARSFHGALTRGPRPSRSPSRPVRLRDVGVKLWPEITGRSCAEVGALLALRVAANLTGNGYSYG
jgi:hypothetical protein